jgi:hypothetical protein
MKKNGNSSQAKANNSSQSDTDSQNSQSDTTAKKNKAGWVDKNGDGEVNAEDLLIMLRDLQAWVFSWKGATFIFACGLMAACIMNISAWVVAFRSLGAAAVPLGIIVWGAIQIGEVLPIVDELNLDATLHAMIRRQRKPTEVPVLNEDLNPDAEMLRKRFKRREMKQSILAEMWRIGLYALELVVLVLGGNLVTYFGVQWANILIAFLAMVGVELCLRMVNYCGEQLMSPDERAFAKKLKATAKNVSVNLN